MLIWRLIRKAQRDDGVVLMVVVEVKVEVKVLSWWMNLGMGGRFGVGRGVMWGWSWERRVWERCGALDW